MNNYDEYKLNDSTHWEWHTTFLGRYMQHNYRLYYLLDKIFISNPQIKKIVEIGTGEGGLTTFLALWGMKKSISVLSLDIMEQSDKFLLEKLNVNLLIGDEFDTNIQQKIIEFIDREETLFICDGAAKHIEFNFWAPKLCKDSIICAHDLTVEFQDYAISKTIKSKTEPLFQDEWMKLNTQLAIYKITN